MTVAVGFNEKPLGVIDGANDTFTLAVAPNPDCSLQLFHGVGATGVGHLMLQGTHYTLTGNTIVYGGAYIPAAADWHRAWYRF